MTVVVVPVRLKIKVKMKKSVKVSQVKDSDLGLRFKGQRCLNHLAEVSEILPISFISRVQTRGYLS